MKSFLGRKFWVKALLLVFFLGAALRVMHTETRFHAVGCEIDSNLDSASEEGIVAAEADNEDNDATKSMSCKLLVPGPHLQVTSKRPRTAADIQRAHDIIMKARAVLDQYKDYHAAMRAGYQIHLAKVPQKHYHFTNWDNARANIRGFDPTRPTSLLYEKENGEYKLAGMMFTASKRMTEDQLDERFPVSVAPWHLHTNLCTPPKGREREMFRRNSRFGLHGSITTEEECVDAGGTFKPIVYNWMTHVDLYGDK